MANRMTVSVLLSLMVPWTNVLAAKAEKPKVGVMKFDVATGLDPTLGRTLYGVLMEHVVKSKNFTVVDWEDVDRVIQHIAKAQPLVSAEDARKQAVSQIGLERMFVGSLGKVGEKFCISIKVLNLDLSVDKVEKAFAESEDEFDECIERMAAELVLTPEQEKEREDWEEAKEEDTEESYKNFLRAHPKGRYAKEARAKHELKIKQRKKKKERDEETKGLFKTFQK